MKTEILAANAETTVARAAEIIRQGGLLGIPTETVYGLGANGLDPAAVKQIFQAKGRPQDNPLILHVAEKNQVPDFCHDVPAVAWRLMDRFWPGPLTLVLPVKDNVPKETTAGLSTVAVRCPDSALTRAIIRAAGVPIAAPSANISGKPSPTTAQHVLHDMDGKIAGIVDGGPCAVGVESTIVDLTGDKPRLLRPGGITPEMLREILPDLEIDQAVTGEIAPNTVVRAPGMKYTHYTPQGEVIIVTGPSRAAASYIRRHRQKDDWVLCFQEEISLYPGEHTMAYGREDAPETLAHGLFAALRDLDRPEIKTIYARCPAAQGAGFAVANRLKKAAGFHVVRGDALTILGITGPTGSGKTTALQCIRDRGGCVLDLDAIYHGLLETDGQLLQDLDTRFPGVIQKGKLDRKALGSIVFADKTALQDLNEITGQYILAETQRRLRAAEDQGIPLAAIDAINLLEGELKDDCFRTIAVTAPVEVRVQRLMVRDSISEEYARLRISAQQPNEYFADRCDYNLFNDAPSPAEFYRRCDRLLDEILSTKGT
jgi:L-threonylcarbamoyladenylate synthase